MSKRPALDRLIAHLDCRYRQADTEMRDRIAANRQPRGPLTRCLRDGGRWTTRASCRRNAAEGIVDACAGCSGVAA